MRKGLGVRLVAGISALVATAALVSACGDDGPPTIHYVVDATVDSYNANTVAGNANGVVMATARVLPGFSLLGAAGQVTPDRDMATATVLPGPDLAVRYDINPEAVFSDGTAVDCDDVVLAWAAMSGRYPGFTPATTAGYRDISAVDCAAGDKAVTVRFAPGRAYRDWAGLFGAGTLVPAQVVARQAGVPDVVAPIRAGDRNAVGKIARAWNTGLDLQPGPIDEARLPSSGPYRVDRYSTSGGLVLVPNPRWWGDRPKADRIVIWGRDTEDASDRVGGEGHGVVDITGGLVPAADATADASGAWAPQRASGVQELVLSQRGVFGDPLVRQAFASCLPRDDLARRFGQGAQIWNLRSLAPSNALAGQLNSAFGQRYLRADIGRSRTLLGQRATATDGSTQPPVRVRIGYRAPAPRWGEMVAVIADSCRRAGIAVDDAGGTDWSPSGLGRTADAALVAGGASTAAAGAAVPTRDSYQLHARDPLNLGGFQSGAVTSAIDTLAVVDNAGERLRLTRAVENAAWGDVASVPLFAAPRIQRTSGVANVVPGQSRTGTGWNMDRWILEG
ncbi:ABC transporter substrate-binding protein [Gordonia soli]|uniref:Solute-binding protein family 5 domain-containing protein n=1 Tax=Gordonia soli NBRC 108243 TaxID=1223545 RepID=M0QKN1_9ACTN|nr:ABC transporter substrate-binding protein [Gordonia soli]GAC68831.1 hypothetical protein GS4_19_00210 [Gordonia soli NBRC 108243]